MPSGHLVEYLCSTFVRAFPLLPRRFGKSIDSQLSRESACFRGWRRRRCKNTRIRNANSFSCVDLYRISSFATTSLLLQQTTIEYLFNGKAGSNEPNKQTRAVSGRCGR
jgi:hypothetical protein